MHRHKSGLVSPTLPPPVCVWAVWLVLMSGVSVGIVVVGTGKDEASHLLLRQRSYSLPNFTQMLPISGLLPYSSPLELMPPY
ncbi:uncharacterized protein EI90DRAFT_3055860 [Cantharellus anzutake]|uniref:uncharacterized protein n=1 Tax=Cantharellus anzutake TaxID=1750568 RepID=UPI001902C555|nr:uncharacterized protein EI90DRAFT_3055860 [Cantharellus anzutake]KAF8331912.1 hypothetical protein EI90DRAFT_3055860 [Cantharellus anzutake]